MVIRTWWLYLGIVGFLGYLPGFPAELRLLSLLLLMPWLRAIGQRLTRPQKPRSNLAPDLPLPPAAGGKVWFGLRFISAQLLMLFIPSMLRQLFRQQRGDAAAGVRAIDTCSNYQLQAQYRLPFDGPWYAVNGGNLPETSHSWDIVAQRYAYDFVVIDEAKRRWRTDGKTVEDYLCYDLPILAPADGEVVKIVEGVRDAPGVGTGWIDILTPYFPGNAVTIKHAEQEYSFLAHLKPGSIIVQVGDQVRQGQEIGRCGNSGHSSEPHLHVHLQDHEDFYQAAGLPIAFHTVMMEGELRSQATYLSAGMEIAHHVMRD